MAEQAGTSSSNNAQAGQSEALGHLLNSTPLEVQLLITRFTWPHQNMVLRQVKNLWLTRGDSGRIIFRSDEIYDPSSGVYLNQASRVERERCYEQILLRSIPGHEIFFNFDIDTLTIQPCLLRQKREDKDYDLNAPIVRTAERFKLWGPVMTLRILKTLLEDPGNNLERVQGIMVGNFTWEVKRSSDRSYHDEVIRPRELLKHREEFTHALRGGYQNLEELILHTTRRFRWIIRQEMRTRFGQISGKCMKKKETIN
jgi:hypothetical protein